MQTDSANLPTFATEYTKMQVNTTGIKGYIFDLDGVVVDTRPYHFAAWRRLAHQLGVEIDEDHNEILRGLSRIKSLEKIMEWGGLYASEAEKLHWADVKNNWYIDMISRMNPEEVLPGVRDFLAETKASGIKIALVSSSRNARVVLRSVELEHFFDAVIDGTTTKKSKPAPDCFLLAAEALRLAPKVCMVFEDAPVGIQAAKTGGFASVAVGDHRMICNSDYQLESFEKLPALYY